MPTSVAVAVASSVAADAIGVWVGSAIIGKLAGAAIGIALTSALSGSQDSEDFGAGAAAVESQDRTHTVRSAVAPHVTIYGRARVGGTITYLETTDNNEYLHVVVTLAGHVCDEIETLYLGNEAVELGADGHATGTFADYVYAAFSTGEETDQPFRALVNQSAAHWTDAHRQTGRTKIYVRLRWSSDLFPTGMPNITAIVRGKQVYDPRTATTAWSDNAALCVADYLCDTRAGLGCVYADDIDETALIAAANVCDEDVTLAAGGTENRYTCNGIVYATEKPREVIPKLLGAMQGRATWIGGKWRISAGAYATPTVTLTADDFRGGISVQSRISKRDLYNAVKGVFISPENNWQPSDFPPVTSATYQAEDDDERIWQDIRLPFTDSASMAQRLARIELERVRRQITVTAPLRFSAYRLQPGDTVQLTFARFGWTAKVFEVVESTFVVGEDGGLGVDLVLRETDANVYAWTTADEGEFVRAPSTGLPDPFTLGVPGNPAVTESLYETTGSAGAKSRAVVTWAAAADSIVSSYELQFKAAGDSAWTALPGNSAATVNVDDLAPGSYDFRVRSHNGIGRTSAWSGTTRAELVGLTAAPGDVTGFAVVNNAGLVTAAWTLHTDLDVRQGGQVVVRHSPLTSGATWNDGIIVGEFAGNAIRGLVPARSGTYLAKAVDSSGNWSTTAASATITEAMLAAPGTVATLTEDAAFSGTKTNCAVVSSKLQLSTGTLFDSASGNFDSASGNFDAFGGQSTSGTYESSTYIDATTVAARRWEAHCKASSIDNGQDFDEQQGNFDDADGYFDGAVVNDGNVALYIATTQDDPAGTPTWSSWIPWHVGEFSCRAAKFKAALSVDTPAHNIQVSELRFTCRA